MAIPKSLKPRVEKFINIVLGKVVNEELDRSFFKKGSLSPEYTISLYSTSLLPLYIDGRIEVTGEINGKQIPISILTCDALTNKRIDQSLVNELIDAFMKLRIKEIK